MKKIFITCICIFTFLLVGCTNSKKGNLIQLNYEQFKQKIDNKDDFIFIIEKEECPKCIELKQELDDSISKYDVEIYYLVYKGNDAPELINNLKNDFVNLSLVPYISNIRDGKEIDFIQGLENPKEIWTWIAS